MNRRKGQVRLIAGVVLGIALLAGCTPMRYSGGPDEAVRAAKMDCFHQAYQARHSRGEDAAGLLGGIVGVALMAAAQPQPNETMDQSIDRCMTERGYTVAQGAR